MKNNWSQDNYTKAWLFAAHAHCGQKYPGTDLPYLVHVGNVAMETMACLAIEAAGNPDLAVQCALLHDVIEDTGITRERLLKEFGPGIADGVQALSKDKTLEGKQTQMRDSLERIRLQPREVHLVKLADRISNLQAPPHYWDLDKIKAYREEAMLIHKVLGEASPFLSARLLEKIDNYCY